NADEVMNLAYWTSDYVHLGPFRLTSFDPAEGMAFRAYEAYFLGRPKIDVVRVRLFGDENALLSNLLAGTVDLFMESTITPEIGFELKSRWESSDQGTVYITQGFTRFLTPQWRPSVLTEPANLDARVRAALYRALDREALSEGLQAGHRELALWSLLPPGDRYYEATRDGFRPHSFDPDRARAGLAEAGWTPGPDGVLRHQSDGRRFRNTISEAGEATREVAAYADSWRRIGIEVDEVRVPPAQVRDREYRAQYASWEVSGGSGDSIFSRLEGPAASAQNRWVGNRGGYDDPRAQALVDAYREGLSERDQFRAVKGLSDFFVDELPLLVLFVSADPIGVRKGVDALHDVAGGAQAGQPFGTYSRTAHLWDVQ
ncbi:MAG: hypothetical protein HW416_1974, partial [Chloroflexi bacterium]|nr:hypothetical protein [Chloroflexota bacterium]